MQRPFPAAAEPHALWLRRRQAGVGLIEVLVAVLILSIGLLGIALVQSRSISVNNSSMTRTLAVAATYSIFEAMRADRTNALAGSYNNGGAVISAGSCPTTTATFAQQQVKTWCNTELRDRVGASSNAAINCDSATKACTVTITFHTLDCGSATDGQNNDALCSQTVTENNVDLRAQQVVTKALL